MTEQSETKHEIELYSPDSFNVLLEHEANKARRYQHPLTLVHMLVDVETDQPNGRHTAEVFVINALNLQLRTTDIPSKQGNEFLILMPETDEKGGRLVCERMEKLFQGSHEPFNEVQFKLSVYMGASISDQSSPLSARLLTHQATAAMQHARDSHLQKVVFYSEIK